MDELINKKFVVEDLKLRRFDNSKEYVLIKVTKKGINKTLKPEVIKDIKLRLGGERLGVQE